MFGDFMLFLFVYKDWYFVFFFVDRFMVLGGNIFWVKSGFDGSEKLC